MEFENLVKRVVSSLEKALLNYVIVGGFAAIFRGKPRTTMDLDLIIEKNFQKIQVFLQQLKKSNFDVLEDQVKKAIDEETNISIFDKISVLRIDLKIAKNSDEKEVLKQAKTELYKGLKLKIATTEQILYGKILYLGDISNIPDQDLLEYNDVLDFINVYRQSKIINLDWLQAKVKQKNLEQTLQKLLKILENL